MAAASRQGAGAAQRCMLIEIEGPSGAGKSSLIRRLCTAAQFAHRPVVNLADREKVTTDPGWRVGDLMRGIGQRLDPLEAVFLYCARVAARARLVRAVHDDQAVLLCDRFRLSLQVQIRLAGTPDVIGEHLRDLAVRNLQPDLLVFLDVSYPVHCLRLAGRGHPAQPVQRFTRIRELFAEGFQQHPGPKIWIDTTDLAPDEVCAMTILELDQRLPHHGRSS